MKPSRRSSIDSAERAGYLPALSSIAKAMCVPFWWHGRDHSGGYSILYNGTVCFLDTGSRRIAFTADHVLAQYIADIERDSEVVCQFGSATVAPETRIIDRNPNLDLATIDVSDVLVGSTGGSFHLPITWPTKPLLESDALLLGGYPGTLRVEKAVTADLPFQWIAGKVNSTSNSNIGIHLDLANLHWPLHPGETFNKQLGGMSGGPVFRFVSYPIERLELVGVIYEYHEGYELMLARPAQFIHSNGLIIPNATAASEETPLRQ